MVTRRRSRDLCSSDPLEDLISVKCSQVNDDQEKEQDAGDFLSTSDIHLSDWWASSVYDVNFLQWFWILFNTVFMFLLQLSWSKHLFGHFWVLSIRKEDGETGRDGLLIVGGCSALWDFPRKDHADPPSPPSKCDKTIYWSFTANF